VLNDSDLVRVEQKTECELWRHRDNAAPCPGSLSADSAYIVRGSAYIGYSADLRSYVDGESYFLLGTHKCKQTRTFG
jgi:hypothetical protein